MNHGASDTTGQFNYQILILFNRSLDHSVFIVMSQIGVSGTLNKSQLIFYLIVGLVTIRKLSPATYRTRGQKFNHNILLSNTDFVEWVTGPFVLIVIGYILISYIINKSTCYPHIKFQFLSLISLCSRDNFNEAVYFFFNEAGSLPTQMLRRKNRAALFYCSNETYVTSENDF